MSFGRMGAVRFGFLGAYPGRLPALPAGFVFLLGADGAYLLSADGAYLIGAA